MKFLIFILMIHYIKAEIIFEMRLVEFRNPMNRTYSNQLCGTETRPTENCKIGFLFCLVDLPFRNPQNCSLGDHITPVLGSNHIKFDRKNLTYTFNIKKLPTQGIGMMIEVRDYYSEDKYQHVDFYTNALADVPLSLPVMNSTFIVKKRFTSLFNHNSTLIVESKLFCSKNYYGSNCEIYCEPRLHYTCDLETGGKVCTDGYTGDNCEIPNVCTTFPCHNNGTCSSPDGLNYICDCPSGYEGVNCDHQRRDPCFSMPCFNNGKCNSIGSKFQCECAPGFHGTYCEADLRRCPSSPCSKECECIEQPHNMTYECRCPTTPKPLNRHGHFSTLNYLSHARPSAFSPVPDFVQSEILKFTQVSSTSLPSTSSLEKEEERTLKRQPCVDFNPCKHGQCVLNNDTNQFRCECNVGYMGPFCDLIRHPCDFKPCENGICEIVGDLFYKCLCKPNYTGVNCHIELKPCVESTCQNGGSCKSDDIYDPGCDCTPGFTGFYCETQMIEPNPCESNPCKNGGICKTKFLKFEPTYECLCPETHFGENCQLLRNSCESKICLNGASCVQLNASLPICKCPEGFYGEMCQNDENECLRPKVCPENSFCNNKFGTYECICYEGYSMNNLKCERIATLLKTAATLTVPESTTLEMTTTSTAPLTSLELTTPELTTFTTTTFTTTIPLSTTTTTDPCSLCKNNSTCKIESNLDTICVCSKNFKGKHCDEEIDVCRDETPCQNHGVCVRNDRYLTGFLCDCKKGYTGERCEIKIHLCELENPCKNAGICNKIENFNTYTCTCAKGYTGLNCEHELDACVETPCKNGGMCQTKSKGLYHCDCPVGYSGQQCEHDIDVCGLGLCKNNAKCIEGKGENYTCICGKGYTGQTCQFEVDECENKPCLNEGKCDKTGPGEFKCACTDSFTGGKCETKIDKCKGFCKNNSSCIIENNDPKCVCDSYYFGEKCERSIKLLCENKPCTNSGHCRINEITRMPECVCQKGFSGELCEVKNICLPKLQKIACYNNGTCLHDQNNQEFCECQTGFSGDNCELSLRNGSSQSIARDASSLASSDIDALTATQNTPQQADNGVWLIVIVFGYIFGLFLIFVIIWFIWYGTSIKRDRRSSSSSSQNNLNPAGTASSNQFSSYSTNSSLNRPTVGKEIINGYSPCHNQQKQTNRDDYFHKNNLLTQDDLSGSHSTSFVHSYHHRI